MSIAKTYGMIHEGQSSTAAVRTVFFIDDKGMMRAMIYYPLQNGRYIPAILCLIKDIADDGCPQGIDTGKLATRGIRSSSQPLKPQKR